MVPGASRIRDEIETPPTRNHANIRICRPTKRCTCRSALSRPLLLDSGILLERRSYFEWGAQAQYRGAGPAPDRGAISYFELIKRNYQRCYLYSGASYATHRYGSQANARPLAHTEHQASTQHNIGYQHRPYWRRQDTSSEHSVGIRQGSSRCLTCIESTTSTNQFISQRI